MSDSERPEPNPPPLPARPPVLRKHQFQGDASEDAAKGRRKGVLIAVGAIGCGVVLFGGLIVGLTMLFLFTAEEMELSEGEKACIVTIDDVAEWFELEIDRDNESWDNERYFDNSVQIYYSYYDVIDEEVQISCNLTIERKTSDARMMYNMEWGGMKVTNRLLGEDSIELEMANEVFEWGDESKFAFQTVDDERFGFAFVGRKGLKVFFLDCWGVVLEDPEEIREFLTPHLEQYEKESFRKKKEEG